MSLNLFKAVGSVPKKAMLSVVIGTGAWGVRSGVIDMFPPKIRIEKRKSARLPFLCVLVLSAALQCSHFLQFVRDSPIDEIVDSDAC